MRGVPERDHLSENNSSHKVLTQKRVLTTLKIKKKLFFLFCCIFFCHSLYNKIRIDSEFYYERSFDHADID